MSYHIQIQIKDIDKVILTLGRMKNGKSLTGTDWLNLEVEDIVSPSIHSPIEMLGLLQKIDKQCSTEIKK